MTAGFGDGRPDTRARQAETERQRERERSPLRAVRNLFLTGLDPASLAGMAAAVAVAGEYPPPGAGGGPPEFLTGPPGQGPPAPTGGSPGEFLAPSGKRQIISSFPAPRSIRHYRAENPRAIAVYAIDVTLDSVDVERRKSVISADVSSFRWDHFSGRRDIGIPGSLRSSCVLSLFNRELVSPFLA